MVSSSLRACLLFTVLVVAAGAPAAADPAALLKEIQAARLEPERAVRADGLSLNLGTGTASFKIRRGVIFPATPVGGRAVEMVFLGEAALVLDPEDPIEAGQLELFTGAPELTEEITGAVIVVTLDAAADALAGRATAGAAPAEQERARRLFKRWKDRPERRLLGIETAILRDALGDPIYQGFFAGWFRGETLGEFLYLFEPDAQEQVSLGQFKTIEASDREKRKLTRQLHRQQRKGRLIGLDLEDLGQWDTWLSAPLISDGKSAFEPNHYQLEATLSGPRLELHGRARIHLERVTAGRMVKLQIHPDLRISRVGLTGAKDVPPEGGKRNLFHHQVAGEVLAVLPPEAEEEDALVLEVDYAGQVIERVDSKSYALANTTHWYPHAGTVDLATYDVTFRWPEKLELLAAGERTGGGHAEPGLRFERRRLERRSLAFGFEIGTFRTLNARAGNIDVTLAVDALGASALDPRSRELLLAVIIDSLLYFEQIFGPYPLDRLTVVTASREFSQSLLSFVTLSTLSMLDVDWTTLALGLEDRRTIVAHEIAHQWWGHVVGWRSYRDQWISEATANYAATLYARHRLRDEWSLLLGPTAGWQEALTATDDDGRTVESLGPLVLGERLESSRSAGAYQPIVYQKGAIVLDMMARTIGEQSFLDVLGRIVRTASLHGTPQLSTEDFISLIEQLSGRDLTAFAEQFIYGTGLPEVHYDYRFSATEAGRWRVQGSASQRSPYRIRHLLVALPGGGFDVARERLDQIDVTGSALLVPFELEVTGTAGSDVADALITGNLLLQGRDTELDFEVDYPPKELWLDRGQRVFGRFFNQRRHPKRALYLQGVDRAAGDRLDEAEALFRRALAAGVVTGASDLPAAEVRAEGRLFDAGIQIELVRLYLDQSRLAEARVAFDRLHNLVNNEIRFELGPDLKAAEARLALRAGQPERAYRLLRKTAARDDTNTESLLLLAIAARATGHPDQLEAALEAAARRGAAVSAMAE